MPCGYYLQYIQTGIQASRQEQRIQRHTELCKTVLLKQVLTGMIIPIIVLPVQKGLIHSLVSPTTGDTKQGRCCNLNFSIFPVRGDSRYLKNATTSGGCNCGTLSIYFQVPDFSQLYTKVPCSTAPHMTFSVSRDESCTFSTGQSNQSRGIVKTDTYCEVQGLTLI